MKLITTFNNNHTATKNTEPGICLGACVAFAQTMTNQFDNQVAKLRRNPSELDQQKFAINQQNSLITQNMYKLKGEGTAGDDVKRAVERVGLKVSENIMIYGNNITGLKAPLGYDALLATIQSVKNHSQHRVAGTFLILGYKNLSENSSGHAMAIHVSKDGRMTFFDPNSGVFQVNRQDFLEIDQYVRDNYPEYDTYMLRYINDISYDQAKRVVSLATVTRLPDNLLCKEPLEKVDVYSSIDNSML